MSNSVQELVEIFQMIPHPEGGYYRETYRSAETIQEECLPLRFTGERIFSTAIYYLLEGSKFSAFHRIRSDELWHFYAGSTLNIYVIYPNGEFEMISLGKKITYGEHFQAVVKAGCWFAAQPADPAGFAFVGCTVSPGFDFEDFELADAGRLMEWYPQHASLIGRFCRYP
jgi:hypothetical protein